MAKIVGTDLSEMIDGTEFADAIKARRGDDTINSGMGDDTIHSGRGQDVLNGGDGFDFANYQASGQGVNVNLGRDFSFKKSDIWIDVEGAIGSDFGDRLFGNNSANILKGKRGEDYIGGADTDTLVGGRGADTFRFDETSKLDLAVTIRDFSDEDVILLGVFGDDGGEFIGNEEFTGGEQFRFEYVSGSVSLLFNFEDDVKADATIFMNDIGRDLTIDDFIIP